MSDYTGPACTVKTVDGETITVQGDLASVTHMLQRSQHFASLVDIYGRKHSVNPVHVSHVSQLPVDVG